MAQRPKTVDGFGGKLTSQHIESFIQAITVPVDVIVASEGGAKMDGFVDSLARWDNINYSLMDGGHHFHMEAQADEITLRIQQFIDNL